MIRLSIVVVLVMTAGCAHFQESFRAVNSTVLLSDSGRPWLAAHEVEVFIASDEIPVECERVALLRAAPRVAVVDTLRAEAGRLGANAVDLRDFRTGSETRTEMGEGYWNVVALHCPEGRD